MKKAAGTRYLGRITPSYKAKHQQDRVFSADGCSPTIAAGETCGRYLTLIDMAEKERKQIELPEELKGKKFRIRKLTPRECFRLMDVEDSDIDKIQESGLSNSAQYKLAGNSIVRSCLYHIFRKMFIETENESQQLSLF